MYYIINQADKVVAVDMQLLDILHISQEDQFFTKLALGEITLTLEDNEHLRILTEEDNKDYQINIMPLAGIAGESLRLVHLLKAKSQEESKDILLSDVAIESDVLSNIAVISENEEKNNDNNEDISRYPLTEEAEEILSLNESTSESSGNNADSEISKEMLILDDINLFEETSKQTIDEDKQKPEVSMENDDVFQLFDDSEKKEETPSLAIGKEEVVSSETPLPTLTDTTDPIYIDVAHISKVIGISPKDYHNFLNEYINTALSYETALKEDSNKEEAVDVLSRLTKVLHLPVVGDILMHIKAGTQKEVEHFYRALGLFTTEKKTTSTPDTVEKTVSNVVPKEEPKTEEKIELPVITETKEETPSIEERKPQEEEKISTPETTQPKPSKAIDLSDITPIRFDFSIDEAASDLGLPSELIEEFVYDFIEQAHTETQKMIEAYEKGDLERVQKIGHLLKGTSSNLRIIPLSETLYEIQFNDTLERVPELVRNYWGHFLALENQFKLTLKK